MGSASCEAVAPEGINNRQARLEGQWCVLAKRRNTADDRFTTRQKGATRMIQYGVAALVKDMPSQIVFCAIATRKHENRATADCALSWIIRVALNPSNLPGWTTRQSACLRFLAALLYAPCRASPLLRCCRVADGISPRASCSRETLCALQLTPI